MKILSTIAAAALMIGAAAPALAQGHHQAPQAKAGVKTPAGSGAVVKVNGLICDFCVQALNKTFKQQAAVRAITVDLDAKEVRLGFKPGATLDDATINKLIKDAGYNVVSIARRTA